LGWIALEPRGNVVIVELLRPQHAGERRALHGAPIRLGDILLEHCIELVGFGQPVGENAIEIGKRFTMTCRRSQAKPDAGAASGRERKLVMESAFAAFLAAG
jgi:hypothetical protein